jgi:hypothetical protein
VHFFDSALPVRPTFAIDLAPFSSDRTKSADEAENSFMPGRNSSGLHRRSADWTGKRGFGALTAFAASLLETARVWLDEAQLVRPGYRDRVVTVYQDQNEGGLNLAMPKEVVEGLTLRGRLAARKVVTAFAGDQPGAVAWAWRNHRWLRLRSTSAALARYLHDFADAYDADARLVPPTPSCWPMPRHRPTLWASRRWGHCAPGCRPAHRGRGGLWPRARCRTARLAGARATPAWRPEARPDAGAAAACPGAPS